MLSTMRNWLHSFPVPENERSVRISLRAERTATWVGWALLGALAAYRALIVRMPSGEWIDAVALWVLVGGLLLYRGWRIPCVDFECSGATIRKCLGCAKMPYLTLTTGAVVLAVGRHLLLSQRFSRNPLSAVVAVVVVLGESLRVRMGEDIRKEYRHVAKGWWFFAPLIVLLDLFLYGLDWPRLAFMVLFFFVLSRLVLRWTGGTARPDD